MKKFCFTIDDNIRFFRELTETKPKSLFEHSYLALLKRLSEKYDLKIQLNLFYRDGDFDLSQFPDNYKWEWRANATWLKLSFHSLTEKECNYKNASYDEIYSDGLKVKNEIIRFAGEDCLAKTTTIHFCLLTAEGVRAMRDIGVRGLLGLFGTEENPRLSYDCTLQESKICRKGKIFLKNDMIYGGIDCVLNKFTTEEILSRLEQLRLREQIRIMIHEQYFYSDYKRYQADFGEKIEKTVEKLKEMGFESGFFEETF